MDAVSNAPTVTARRRFTTYQKIQIALAVVFGLFLSWRLYTVLFVDQLYGPSIWVRFAITGIVIGSIYALIAIGYTLVYGILFMINFAHGELLMFGAFAGYFVYEALGAWIVDPEAQLSFMNAYPIIATLLAFAAGTILATIMGIYLEKIAYRPLRSAPRLVPLISAIGASIFLQNAALLLFGAQRRSYTNPDLLDRAAGFPIVVDGSTITITYTSLMTLILSIVLLGGLYVMVQRTKLGRAMRAVAEDKGTASLMGIDVDDVISKTFAISGGLAGAAGVMFGIQYGQIYFFMGFLLGLKAFTAAVLGGIGNIPGAMMGGMTLGILESIGPAAINIDFQLKDVIAFSILVLVLIFRPTGILGEVLAEEKV